MAPFGKVVMWDMSVWQGICLSLLLVLALYGCAQWMIKVALWFDKPRVPTVKLCVVLQPGDAVEQQLRFARRLSQEWGLALEVMEGDLSDEEHQIAVLFNPKS